MAQHTTYWTCTKFANWLRGTEKPFALGWKEWDDWHAEAKAAHPVRYWIAEEALGKIQDIIYWPADKVRDIKYYINNRWVTRTHALTSTLDRGRWYDFDTRLLFSMFDSFVDYVEIELAWREMVWNPEARKKYKMPWYAHGYWNCWRTFRCPEAGIAALVHRSGLVLDESCGVQPTDPEYGTPTGESVNAKETLALYYWWKRTRPNRPDPYTVSGWSDLCDKYDLLGGAIPADIIKAKERSTEVSDRLEKMYKREDEQMMIRLIKLREYLWT